jgi:hypothetical protein
VARGPPLLSSASSHPCLCRWPTCLLPPPHRPILLDPPQPPAPTNHPYTPTLSPRHQHAQHTQPASITLSFSPCIAGDVAASRVASVFGESFIIPSPSYSVVASRSQAALLITTAYDRAARAKPSSGTYGLPLHRLFRREKACPFNPPHRTTGTTVGVGRAKPTATVGIKQPWA